MSNNENKLQLPDSPLTLVVLAVVASVLICACMIAGLEFVKDKAQQGNEMYIDILPSECRFSCFVPSQNETRPVFDYDMGSEYYTYIEEYGCTITTCDYTKKNLVLTTNKTRGDVRLHVSPN